MTRPRSELVSLEATPYYHCISRCVRRAFLCGQDRYSGRSFDHRKGWLVERLALLSSIFAINIAAYAIMSNHFHLVLHIDKVRANAWTDSEVLHRWTQLYKGPLLVQRHLAGQSLNTPEMEQLAAQVSAIREKLSSISKFMAALNEYIARKANIEDGCTGRFWEGRFKSQALLDNAGLLSCMAYVDLNPVRAGIANGLEDSDFTSIQNRIREVRACKKRSSRHHQMAPTPIRKPALMPFAEIEKDNAPCAALPFRLKDYLALTEWTGRCVRSDKRGHIPVKLPGILEKLRLSDAQWRFLALELQKKSVLMLNGLDALAQDETRAVRRTAA